MGKVSQIILSYPKCGRTWLRVFFDYYQSKTGRNLFLHYTHKDIRGGLKRILMVRHPCDIMVSYYFHRVTRNQDTFTIDEFIRNERFGIPNLNRCYKQWIRYDRQMIIRYEELFMEAAWKKMLNYFETEIEDLMVYESFQLSKFDAIKKNLRQWEDARLGWRFLAVERGKTTLNPTNPEAHKFRRGIVGGYIDYMNKEQIEYVMDNFSFGLAELDDYYRNLEVE